MFPSNGGWDEEQTIEAVDGSQFTPYTDDFISGQVHYWGVGDPALSPRDQTGSWGFSILPYLEQTAMHDQRKWTLPVNEYVCPSRRSPVAEPVVAEDDYGRYEGGGWEWGKTDYAANSFVIPNRPQVRAMRHLVRGTSNTVLVGEKAFNPRIQGQNWHWDEPFFTGGSRGTSRQGFGIQRDGRDGEFRVNWGSAHPGVAHFVFGDGSVRGLSYETDWMTVEQYIDPHLD